MIIDPGILLLIDNIYIVVFVLLLKVSIVKDQRTSSTTAVGRKGGSQVTFLYSDNVHRRTDSQLWFLFTIIAALPKPEQSDYYCKKCQHRCRVI